MRFSRIPRPRTPTRVALLALDPRNVTHGAGVLRGSRCGPLCPGEAAALAVAELRSLAAGRHNVHLGVRFRRLLAQHIFARVGRNFKAFQYVEFSFGYNMEVGDDVVVHRNVLLDDRGGIVLGDRVSISDYANIYSHTHSIVDQKDVTNARTVLEDDVRITYHATVLAGVRVGKNAHGGRERRRHQRRTAVPRQRGNPCKVYPGKTERTARGLCE